MFIHVVTSDHLSKDTKDNLCIVVGSTLAYHAGDWGSNPEMEVLFLSGKLSSLANYTGNFNLYYHASEGVPLVTMDIG